MVDDHSKQLFWGCFIALITTAFRFITRRWLSTTGTQASI